MRFLVVVVVGGGGGGGGGLSTGECDHSETRQQIRLTQSLLRGGSPQVEVSERGKKCIDRGVSCRAVVGHGGETIMGLSRTLDVRFRCKALSEI